MSGHSKWATIHRAKEIKDQARGKLFTKYAQAITIAARTGGGPNPESNFKLRVAIDKAREANMPKDNIDRAIAKVSEAGAIDEVTYEGFGPSGIQVIVEAATNNRNRTGQEVKNIFERAGGRFGGPGSVSFNFTPKGYIEIEKDANSEDQILKLIDLGIEDLEETDEGIDIYTSPTELFNVHKKLEEAGYKARTTELIQKPLTFQKVENKDDAEKVINFLGTLDEHDDVQKVFSNFEV